MPGAIDRAAARKVADRQKRDGTSSIHTCDAASVLDRFAAQKKSYLTAQYLANRRRFERVNSPRFDEATVSEAAIEEFERDWDDKQIRLALVPGKEALSFINQHLQKHYSVSVTATSIVDAMQTGDIPIEMRELVKNMGDFVART